jgi:hypothetical protein
MAEIFNQSTTMPTQPPVFDTVLYAGMLLLPVLMLTAWIRLFWQAKPRGALRQLSRRLASKLSYKTLVSLQIFRLPLELLMLRAALLGVMPVEFSMLGYNFDVLTGLGALLLTITIVLRGAVPKSLLWAWNMLGIICLLVIVVLAFLTSPNIHAFGLESVHINSWVLYFPYSFLPTVLVPLAALGHILTTHKLLLKDGS